MSNKSKTNPNKQQSLLDSVEESVFRDELASTDGNSHDSESDTRTRPINEPGYRDQLSDSVVNTDYLLNTTANQQILPDLTIPAIAYDGTLVDSGISFNDVAIKPSVCESGSLAFFDGNGRLMAAALGSVAHLGIQDIVIRDDNVIRIKDYQFEWGRSTRHVSIDRHQLHYCDNSTAQLCSPPIGDEDPVPNPIVFPEGFVERPLLFMMAEGANSFTVTGVNCNVNGILSVRMTFTDLLDRDFVFNWLAIGRWR